MSFITVFNRRTLALTGTFFVALLLMLAAIAWPWPRSTPYSPIRPVSLADSRAAVQMAALSALVKSDIFPDFQSQIRLDLVMHTLGKELSTSRWLNTTINVCWEPESVDNLTEKQWTKDAVQKSWEAHSKLRFVGWGNCSVGQSGVHIQVADVPPESLALGKNLDGKTNGLVLNFVMKATPIPCGNVRETCIRSIAVHEFGHVIGLVHETYNDGVPDACATKLQGPDGDHSLTPYDPASVMNYCNPLYGNLGVLSQGDILSVNKMYP